MQRLTRILFVPMILALAFPALAQEEEAEATPSSLVGKEAPAVKLPLLDGGELDISQYKGEKYVVLDFWTTWCPWCRRSTDKFVELSKQYADQEVAFFMVSVGEEKAPVAEYFEKNQVEAKIALDSNRAVSDQYFVDYIPHIVVIDKEGKVVEVAVGQDKVAAALTETLAELFPEVKTADATN